jgi:spore germination protein GerM
MTLQAQRKQNSKVITRLVTSAMLALTPFVLASCGDNGAGPSASPTPTVTVPFSVYYAVDTGTDLRLARETRDLVGADPAMAAVELMIAGAEDPDYATTWNAATEVLDVTYDAGAITVDLSADARTANVGSPGAALMMQQLVYTVTEVLDETAAVELLVEGQPAGELWGAVAWDEPIVRAAPEDVLVFVQIDIPRDGATTSSPLTVEGEANVFEANLPWRVLDAEGTVVESSFTMTSEGFTFAPFSFTVELEPGTYTVEITEDDPSGGEGREPMTDTKTVTIE